MREDLLAFTVARGRLGYETDELALEQHAESDLQGSCSSLSCHRDTWAFFDWCFDRWLS